MIFALPLISILDSISFHSIFLFMLHWNLWRERVKENFPKLLVSCFTWCTFCFVSFRDRNLFCSPFRAFTVRRNNNIFDVLLCTLGTNGRHLARQSVSRSVGRLIRTLCGVIFFSLPSIYGHQNKCLIVRCTYIIKWAQSSRPNIWSVCLPLQVPSIHRHRCSSSSLLVYNFSCKSEPCVWLSFVIDLLY